MNIYVAIILVIAFVLAGMSLMMLATKKKTGGLIDRNKYERAIKHIDGLLRANDVVKARQAVIEADKLLDAILKVRVGGGNLGARLRNAKNIFSNSGIYNKAWEAHKLRNHLVHEIDYGVSDNSAKKAVADFKKVFKHLGY
ncbi:hypothetical protein KJ855_01865 [Patescibacteria group bacterium]|nr:hypothetical protein [Patescibacteria group bacterium]